MPILTKLKNKIEDCMKRNMIFQYSHEILFNTNISLEKYCIALVYKGDYEDIPESVINKANHLKIPIKIYSKSTNSKWFIRINRFIDVIEN
jgi:hypothetical protein